MARQRRLLRATPTHLYYSMLLTQRQTICLSAAYNSNWTCMPPKDGLSVTSQRHLVVPWELVVNRSYWAQLMIRA